MKGYTLTPKTARGSKYLQSCGTNQFKLIETKDMVCFTEKKGPWLHLTPSVGSRDATYARYVHATDDKDFTVTEQ